MKITAIMKHTPSSIKEAVENPQKPERIPTGMGKSTVSNPAYLPTGFYSGDPEKFEFTRQQQVNYDVIKSFLAKQGKRLDYIGAGKSPRGNVIFVATGPGVVWYKYEATSTASAVNVLYLNGSKISVGDFLRKSEEARDSLMKSDSVIHNFTQHQDFFRFINALNTETNVADLNAFFASKGSGYVYTIIVRNTVENPKRLTTIAKAKLKLDQLGADTRWMNMVELIEQAVSEIVDRIFYYVTHDSKSEIANYLNMLPDQYRQQIMQRLYDKIAANEEKWVTETFKDWMIQGSLQSQYTMYSVRTRNLATVGYQPQTFTLENIFKVFSKDAVLQVIDRHISAYRRDINRGMPSRMFDDFFDLIRIISNLISSVPDELVPTIYRALTERRRELVELARDGITSGYFDAYYKMTAPSDVVLNWPELQPQNMRAVVDTPEYKQKTMRNLLVALKENRSETVVKIMTALRVLELEWPELAKIEAVINRQRID